MKRYLKKLRALIGRRRLDRDIEDELRFHLDMQAASEPDPADARRRFGNRTSLQESCRELWTFTALESLWRDIEYAVSTLAASPGFTAIAISALGLGIGANAAMFSILNGALSWNLGLDDLKHTVVVNTVDPSGARNFGSSYADFQDLRAQTKTLDGLAAYQFGPVNVSGSRGLPERYFCVKMSANGFSVALMKPLLGRGFVPDDERPGAAPVLMLGHHVWQERFGGDPAIVGKTVRVDDVPMTVIGVMPRGRRFPEETDLWSPLIPSGGLLQRSERALLAFGHLAPGVPVSAARDEFKTLSRRLAVAYPETNRGLTAELAPVETITGAFAIRAVLAILWVAVGFVLLIACADVANMLLARGARRAREISIRIAIGAGRMRILRQLLVESLLLALGGGVAGWGIAAVGMHWFDSSMADAGKPIWLSLSLNRTAFVYLGAVTLATGFLFGLAPAMRLARLEVNSILKDGGAAGGRRSQRLSTVLVAAEMALCVILLAGAGLAIRSAVGLYNAPLGINPAGVLTMRINLPEAKYAGTEARILFQKTLRERLENLPGVVSADLASNRPLGGWFNSSYELEGAPSTPGQAPRTGTIAVGAHYFDLLQLRPRSGRFFTDMDGVSGPPAVVVNESFAGRFWPGLDPLGKRLRLLKGAAPQPWLTVVGVSPDVVQNMRNPLQHDPIIYLPFALEPDRAGVLLARTAVPPATLIDAFRREVQSVDSNLPVFDIRTLEGHLAQTHLSATLFGALLTVFAAVALILGGVGLYGVVGHSISERTQEIGIRMAIGGARRDILRLVFRIGMKPLTTGLAIGLPVAIVLSRVLRGVLVGVPPADPLVLAGVVLALLLAGALGCAVPARRAMRVDPAVTLRHS